MNTPTQESGFYNTVGLPGAALREAVAKATKQDEAILKIYQTGQAFSPSQIFGMCERAGKNWPIQSIRRAVTNLTNDGKLTKTDKKITGLWGAKEFQWQIINQQNIIG